jgi:RsiW-degrading membrane proteinase PrsW (M82 family)
MWQLEMELNSYSRYIAPFTEEIFKSIFIIYLILSKRVGFLVDAAIMGFALGAGFAIVENVHYLYVLPESTILVTMQNLISSLQEMGFTIYIK